MLNNYVALWICVRMYYIGVASNTGIGIDFSIFPVSKSAKYVTQVLILLVYHV